MVAHKKGGFSLFRLPFDVVSGLVQLSLVFVACPDLVLQFSNVEFTEYFDLQTSDQLHVDFITSGSNVITYKVG